MFYQRSFLFGLAVTAATLVLVSESQAQRASMRGGFRFMRSASPSAAPAYVQRGAYTPARSVARAVSPAQAQFVPVQNLNGLNVQLAIASQVAPAEGKPDATREDSSDADDQVSKSANSDTIVDEDRDELELSDVSTATAQKAKSNAKEPGAKEPADRKNAKSQDRPADGVDPTDPATELKPGMILKGGGRILSVGKPGEKLEETDLAELSISEAAPNSKAEAKPAAAKDASSAGSEDRFDSGKSILIQE